MPLRNATDTAAGFDWQDEIVVSKHYYKLLLAYQMPEVYIDLLSL